MKIAFIAGSLARAQDGVADYTRALALGLTRLGHECRLLGLSDSTISDPIECDLGGDAVSLPALRLAHSRPWPERISCAGEFLDAFGPDWISLQFVPYGYHQRGVVHGLAPRLKALVAGRPLHVMMHELWIGQGAGAMMKERVVGALQGWLVRGLLSTLRPQLLHASNPTYVNLLHRRGFPARCLPLFSNIPLQSETADGWLFAELQNAGAPITPANRPMFWLTGFFGSLHPVWPPEPLLSKLREAGARQQRRVVLIAIGRLGPGLALWNQLAHTYADVFTFLQLGVRSELEISQFFNAIDFGVATSPLALIGKSGTVAAMLEHDLPVIVNRESGFRDGLDAEPVEGVGRFIRLDDHFEESLARPRRRQPQSRLPRVCAELIDALQGAVPLVRPATPARAAGSPAPRPVCR